MTPPKFDTRRVVVIGAGLSGLASAALLAKAGWQVTVVEKNAAVGGRARVLGKKGFTFDMGPSWYLMPEVFENFFAAFGKHPGDYYKLMRLDPRYRVFFGDGQSLTLSDNITQNRLLFDQIEPGAGAKLSRFLARMKQVYTASTSQLMSADIWSPRTWVNPANISAIFKLTSQLRFWDTWNDEVKRHFISPKLQQILCYPAVFLGGSPFNTPALYSILTWADFGKGVWYPQGGMGKIVSALADLATENGAAILTGEEVSQIEVQDSRVTGVKTNKRRLPAGIVVGSADLHHLQTCLLPSQYRDWDKSYWAQKTLGISALILYLGVDKKIPDVVHHNLYFSTDWQKNFQEIFGKKEIPSDPSLYVSVRSASDPGIAPKNCEEIFVLVPLGAGGNYPTSKLQSFTDEIINRVGQLLNFDIKNHLLVKEIFTPQDFASDYNAFSGTALGLAHTLNQSLWLRPGNKSHKVQGLYFTGQYTQPGVGVPMALISAQITARHIGNPPAAANIQIFKNGSTTYYYSSLFFSDRIKKDVFSLYAYVRTVDDLVDQPSPKTSRFNYMWEQTQAAWHGQNVSNQIIRDFIQLARRRNFDWEWINAFWQAMNSDLTKKIYRNYKELEKYMYGSAEVIGLMMARIFNLPQAALPAAALQGRAMQYLNFIRDVQEDERLGRNYLGYTQSQKNDSQKWDTFIRQHLERYQALQSEAARGYQFIPAKLLVPVKTAAQMYLWTANRINKNPKIVLRKKVKPSKWRVIAYVIRNYFAAK